MAKALKRLGFEQHKIRSTQDYYRTGKLSVKDGQFVANEAHHNYFYWDYLYPDSRFILQMRDEESWLPSLKNHLTRNKPDTENRRLKRVAIVGTYGFNEEYHKRFYRLYNLRVIEYFSKAHNLLGSKVHKLLIHRTGIDGYRSLCDFLDVPVVDEQWPHENKTVKR